MAGDIKGITIDLGADVSGVKKAFRELTADSKQVTAQLRQIDRALKLDPGNTALVAQKQELLARAVSKAADQLQRAKEMQRQFVEAGGDVNSDAYTQMGIEIGTLDARLNNLTNQSDQLTSSLDESANAAQDAGDAAGALAEGSEQAADALDDTEDSAKGAGMSVQDYLQSIAKNVSTLTAFTVKLKMVKAALSEAKEIFVDSVIEVAQFGDAIDKGSQQMAISARGYQEWGYILKRTGTDIEAMAAAMKTLSSRAAAGSASFEKLGISMEELARMSPEARFNRVVAALQGVENQSDRARIAADLFGKNYTKLNPLLNMSASAVSGLRDEFSQLGGVMSDTQVKASADLTDALTRWDTAAQGFKNTFAEVFTPLWTEVVNFGAFALGGFTNVISGNWWDSLVGDWVGIVRTAQGQATDAVEEGAGERAEIEKWSIEEIEANLDELARAYDETYKSIQKQVSGFFKTFQSGIETNKEDIGQMTAALQEQTAWNQNYAKNMQAIGKYAEESGQDFTALNKAIAESGTAGAGYAAAIADAIKAGDSAKVDELVSSFTELQGAQNALAQTLTNTSDNWAQMAADAGGAIEDVKSRWRELEGLPDIKKNFDVVFNLPGGGYNPIGAPQIQIPEHKMGLDYVPYDNYLAYLHQGERVLTAEENRAYSQGEGGGVTINQYISAPQDSPAQLAAATEAMFQRARWMG